jgi:flagellar assembly protein FliH
MTRAQNRFIPGEEIGSVADWNFAAVDQTSLRFAAKLKAQQLAEEQAKSEIVRQAGYTEGFSQGFAQGQAKATLEGQRLLAEYISTQGKEAARNMGELFAAVQSQLADSEQDMAKGLLELACELARQVLRHELASNPNALQPVIREALGMLAVDSKAAVVRMHPLDMDVLAEVLRQEFSYLSLTLLADSSIKRGGCLVESAGTVVDGTVEKRWMRAVATLGLDPAWEVEEDAS